METCTTSSIVLDRWRWSRVSTLSRLDHWCLLAWWDKAANAVLNSTQWHMVSTRMSPIRLSTENDKETYGAKA